MPHELHCPVAGGRHQLSSRLLMTLDVGSSHQHPRKITSRAFHLEFGPFLEGVWAALCMCESEVEFESWGGGGVFEFSEISQHWGPHGL